MTTLPVGTVTLLFTDIEGSTGLLERTGDKYSDLLAEHRRVLRAAFNRHGGVQIGTEGDSFFVAFASAVDALAAAHEGQEVLASGEVRVRMGMHTGEPQIHDPEWFEASVAAAVGATDELVAQLRDRHSLLILDNFEQLAGAADRLAQLIESCAGIACIVTSREALHLRGEREFPLEPLTEDA